MNFIFTSIIFLYGDRKVNLMCGLSFQLGTTIAPYIVDLGGQSNPRLPPGIFGLIMMLASLTFLFLPETKGLPLVQTVEDMRRQKTWTIAGWLCCSGKKNKNDNIRRTK